MDGEKFRVAIDAMGLSNFSRLLGGCRERLLLVYFVKEFGEPLVNLLSKFYEAFVESLLKT